MSQLKKKLMYDIEMAQCIGKLQSYVEMVAKK